MEGLKKILEIANRKFKYDKLNNWGEGSNTYLLELKKEVDEVIEEMDSNRLCHLEVELGDILWDYINVLINLQNERGIQINSVLDRASKKYNERVSGLENGEKWNEIKLKQKKELMIEEGEI